MKDELTATQRPAATTPPDRVVEVAYGNASGIEVVVPYGTKISEFVKLGPVVFDDVVGRLPRGCSACLSGDNLIIRERFEHVLRVDLDRMAVTER